jgi:hypothetical protein
MQSAAYQRIDYSPKTVSPLTGLLGLVRLIARFWAEFTSLLVAAEKCAAQALGFPLPQIRQNGFSEWVCPHGEGNLPHFYV